MEQGRRSAHFDRVMRTIAAAAGIATIAIAGLAWWLKSTAGASTTLHVSLGLVALVMFAAAAASGKWAQRAVLVFFASALAFLLGEIVLQLVPAPGLSTIYALHETYLHSLIPGSARFFDRSPVNGGQRIVVRVNDDGYRGEPLLEGAHPRIVVYGDSFIEAEFSELGNTFAEQLEGRLTTDRDPNIEVVNAGVVAYGPDQVARRMQDELPRLKPRLSIVAVYAGNDYGELVRNRLFALSDSGHVVENEPRLHTSLRTRFGLARWQPATLKLLDQGGTRLASIVKWRFEHHFGVRPAHAATLAPAGRDMGFIDESLESLSKEYAEHVVRGSNEVRSLFGDPYDADVALLPKSESSRYKRQLMTGVLERIQRTADSNQVGLLLLIIPSPIDLCESHDLGRVDRARYPEYRRTELTGFLERTAADLGIDALDLFEPFQQRGGCRLYFGGNDNHWNDEGQRVAADVVMEHLSEHSEWLTAQGYRSASDGLQ